MGYISNWESVSGILAQKQQSPSGLSSCKLSRYYSVEESRGKEQGLIVSADLKAAHQVFKKFPGVRFILRLVVGDSLQHYRLQATYSLKPEIAYEKALRNGTEFVNWMRPAVVNLKKEKKEYSLEIEIAVWDQELLKDFPTDCIPPTFDPDESDESYQRKHELWYRPYVERKYSDLLNEEKLSDAFKKSRNFVLEMCQNPDIKEKLKKAAVKYIAGHDYQVTTEMAETLTINYFHHEISNTSKSSCEILLYGLSVTARKGKGGFIAGILVEVTQAIWKALGIVREFILFYFRPDKGEQRQRHQRNLEGKTVEQYDQSADLVPSENKMEEGKNSGKEESSPPPDLRAAAIQNYTRTYSNSGDINFQKTRTNATRAHSHPFDKPTYAAIKQHLEETPLVPESKSGSSKEDKVSDKPPKKEKEKDNLSEERFTKVIDRVLFQYKNDPRTGGKFLKELIRKSLSDEEIEKVSFENPLPSPSGSKQNS